MYRAGRPFGYAGAQVSGDRIVPVEHVLALSSALDGVPRELPAPSDKLAASIRNAGIVAAEAAGNTPTSNG